MLSQQCSISFSCSLKKRAKSIESQNDFDVIKIITFIKFNYLLTLKNQSKAKKKSF